MVVVPGPVSRLGLVDHGQSDALLGAGELGDEGVARVHADGGTTRAAVVHALAARLYVATRTSSHATGVTET